MPSEEHICKVCGTHYEQRKSRCPKCGCRHDETVPAFLRCKRCGTVFPSKSKQCPACGQSVSPQTATGTLLPAGYERRRRRTRTSYILATAVLLLLLVGEGFLVNAVYANITYHESLRMWQTGGSIEANRRAPDPVYEEPVLPEIPDSLFNDGGSHSGNHASESEASEEYIEDIADSTTVNP